MKRKLSFLMIFIMIFTVCVNTYTVKADFIFDYFDWSVEALREVGLIYDPSLHPKSLQDVADEINENDPDADVQATNESIGNYITENTTVNNDNSKTYNQKVKNIINFQIDAILNETGFRYVYTFNIINHATEFSSGEKYLNTRDFVADVQSEGKIFSGNRLFDYGWTVDMSNAAFVRNSESGIYYEVTVYDLSTWEKVSGDRYEYDGDSYNLVTGQENNNVLSWVKKDQYSPSNMGGDWCYLTSGQNNVYKMYMSLADLKAGSVGQAPYYFNNSVYNNWSTSSGDYTVTTDNSNDVTYGDITNYVDSFNTEYGRYPSDTDVFKWIENPTVIPTPTPNPDNPSGGGSFVNNNNPIFNNNPNINITLFPSVSDNGLNGGTVSGNGGQGSIGNIFDWIGNLGNVIANLIKNVGEMIVNALQGVVEAVTTILSGIPNILTPIIEFVFGGLPDEVQALITLGITCIIFVGIIKVLKR